MDRCELCFNKKVFYFSREEVGSNKWFFVLRCPGHKKKICFLKYVCLRQGTFLYPSGRTNIDQTWYLGILETFRDVGFIYSITQNVGQKYYSLLKIDFTKFSLLTQEHWSVALTQNVPGIITKKKINVYGTI